jgi:hypothetical protein
MSSQIVSHEKKSKHPTPPDVARQLQVIARATYKTANCIRRRLRLT